MVFLIYKPKIVIPFQKKNKKMTKNEYSFLKKDKKSKIECSKIIIEEIFLLFKVPKYKWRDYQCFLYFGKDKNKI